MGHQVSKSIRLSLYLFLNFFFFKAIFQLYYESLSPLIRSNEVTQLFPLLTQIGNAIIFSLLLEQALVSTDLF